MELILEKIIAAKRKEVNAKAALGIFRDIEKRSEACLRTSFSLRDALLRSDTGIIAEFKRCSPSKREIHPFALASEIIPAYQESGATGCSVLTETTFFGGSLSDLAIARESARVPLLRKDFIIDPRQIFEARIYGADAILLIASALSKKEIASLTATAHWVGLEVLLEIHGEDELEKICTDADIVGINNRNLFNFETSLTASGRLASQLPEGMVKISESGIKSAQDVKELRSMGFNGFLIGETFMRHDNPGAALKQFIDEIKEE